jgi:tetratricopeptide (TPR) repeat protein
MVHWRFGIMAVVAAFMLCMPGVQAASIQDQADDLEISALDLEAKGDLDGAILKHREAVKLVPKNKAFKENFANCLNRAAVAKHEAKDDTTAIAYLEEAVSVLPSFKAAKDNLVALKGAKLNQEGIALLKVPNFQGAVDKFNEVLALDPDNKPAKINRDVAQSELLIQNGDPAGAVAKLQEAVSLDPSRQFLKDELAKAQTAADAKAAEDAKKKQEQEKK